MRWNLALLMVLAVLALIQTVAAWEEGTFSRNYLKTEPAGFTSQHVNRMT